MPALHTHLPPLHDCADEHLTPQLPQLFWSAAVLMHCCAQKSWPEAQVQTPPEQDRPPVQAVLQSPQWSALVLKLAHVPEHSVWPDAHEVDVPPVPPLALVPPVPVFPPVALMPPVAVVPPVPVVPPLPELPPDVLPPVATPLDPPSPPAPVVPPVPIPPFPPAPVVCLPPAPPVPVTPAAPPLPAELVPPPVPPDDAVDWPPFPPPPPAVVPPLPPAPPIVGEQPAVNARVKVVTSTPRPMAWCIRSPGT
jgi:hypothetical protein